MSLILNIIVILLVFEAKVYSNEEIDELDTLVKVLSESGINARVGFLSG
jgi:hypothetical protein